MNLLIVDDQTSVVNGIAQGISWTLIGVTQVYTAFNAFEAKMVLKDKNIDIMLCDIEMPLENGIELLQWVRQENIDLECIFLTAHAEFEYAKAAIKAGGYDYIVQPATYEEIQKVIASAVIKVLEKKSYNKIQSLYKAMLEQKDVMKGTILRDMINGSITPLLFEKYRDIVTLPQWSQSCYCILVQITDGKDKLQQFGDELLQFIVRNISAELFASYEQDIILYPESEFSYFVMVYGIRGYCMDYEGIIRQAALIRKHLLEFFDISSVFYVSDSVRVCDIREIYQELVERKSKNVAAKSGIFGKEQKGFVEGKNEYHLSSLKRWKKYLSSNLIDTVREEMKEYLNQLAEQGQLNQNVLYHFHIDLIRLICDSLEEYKVQPHEVMKQITDMDLYKESVQSFPGMLRFIEAIMDLFIDHIPVESNRDITTMVKEYIHDNISMDLKRTDVALAVHLNPDYLTRIFKRDTGVTIGEYIIYEKMNVARNLIKTTALPIKFVASRVGYDNFSHFSHSYKKVHGISPSEERK